MHKSLGDANKIINNITLGNTDEVINMISHKGYTQSEISNIKDVYDNNLLHLAVQTSNVRLTLYFLKSKISHKEQNKFGKSPWQTAVTYNNPEIVNTFTDYMASETSYDSSNLIKQCKLSNELATWKMKYNSENEKYFDLKVKYDRVMHNSNATDTELNMYKRKYESVKIDYNIANDERRVLTTNYNSAKSNLTSVKCANVALQTTNAELRYENTQLKKTNKRLMSEAIELTDKNKKLKTSVDTLMKTTKK
jgi:hypothetical protein